MQSPVRDLFVHPSSQRQVINVQTSGWEQKETKSLGCEEKPESQGIVKSPEVSQV